MQRRIARMFQDGDLRASSTLNKVPYIGAYLYRGLRTAFAPRAQNITIRRFARAIEVLDLTTVKSCVQRALQNARNNQCIQTSTDVYHVADYNQKGYEAIIALIKVLARNPLGRYFAFDARRLRLPPYRGHSAKRYPCLSRRRCPSGRWYDGLCQPRHTENGFDGVHPFSGQTRHRNASRRRRGRYARSRSAKHWRRPGPMRHV